MKNLLGKMKEGRADIERRMPKAPGGPEEAQENALIKAIDAHLEKQNKTYVKKKTGFSPSDTNDCARRMVLMLNGVEITIKNEPRLYRIFDNGHSMHERYTKYFEDMGILVEAEREIWNDDPPIKGFVDIIIEFNGKLAVIELKSIGEDGFAYRKQFNKPKDDHVRQVRVYGRILKIDELFVLYENKNTQEICVFKVEQDDVEINKLFAKWSKIHKQFLEGEMPKRPVRSPQSKKCTYCECYDVCWSMPE